MRRALVPAVLNPAEVLDDEPYRSWESTAEYRRWCNEHLPDWLGYGTD